MDASTGRWSEGRKAIFMTVSITKYSLLWRCVDRNKNAVTCKYSVKGNNNKTSVSLRI